MDKPFEVEYALEADKGYLGESTDMKNNVVHGFLKDDHIHLVYDMGKEGSYKEKDRFSFIRKNMDKYLWTPFAEFAAIAINLELKNNRELKLSRVQS